MNLSPNNFKVGVIPTLALLIALSFQSAIAAVSEDDVKLVLLYKIARFVDWPQQPMDVTFNLCVIGKRTHKAAKERLSGRNVDGRPLRAKLLEASDDASGCDALYISESERPDISSLVAKFSGVPALTVSDAPQFSRQGGMVELTTQDSRIGMTINVAAYQRAGLKINSQLLEISRLIDHQRVPESDGELP